MNRDALLGVLGGLLLLAAMVGVFFYEADYYDRRNPAQEVSFPTMEAKLLTRNGDAATEKTETVPVGLQNLTAIVFVLTWTDTVGGPDSFRLKVTGPGGNFTGEASGSSGQITVRVADVNPVPEPREERGDDATLQSRLGAQALTRGMGDWKVEITCAPVGGTLPTEADPGNTYMLEVKAETYRATW